MRKHHRLGALALALVLGAITAAASTAGNGNDHEAKRVASLRKQIAVLMRANDRFSPPGIARQLEKAKSALEKYRSVDVAKADGYVAEGPCESTATDPGASWWGGAMGIHYVNESLLKSPLDATKPPILTYAPGAGGLELLAAEWFKPDADQSVQTDDDRPTLFGRAFDGPMLGHAPGMPIHYDLHVWLWKHNPSGLFAPFNPAATCTP